MDEVSKRLHDAAEKCIKSYEAWQSDKKDTSARESLNESLHELRRATAALEIDMIREERMSGGVRPISTPSHRSSVRKDEDFGNANDDIGNRGGSDDNHGNGGGGGQDRGPRRHGGGGQHRSGGSRHGGGGRGPRQGGDSQPRENNGNE